MANGFDELRSLGEETLDYLKLRWASTRLAAVDTLSAGAARVAGVILVWIAGVCAAIFLMVALALWIGEVTGSYALGFLVAGGGFLLAAVIFWLARRRLFAGSMVRHFARLFFTCNDDDHGTRK